jgi:RNA polymerase-interacting CarD/CdnL/TRCF family regulator
MVFMSQTNSTEQDFFRGDRVVHPTRGAGTIYQDLAGFKNAMVEFDNEPNVVVGKPVHELQLIHFR